MTSCGWQDCPDAVRRQVDQLLDGVRAILVDQLLGVYLHGSLAMGCFNPLRSDVDLLAVTLQPLPIAARRSLLELLLRLSRQPAPIEISFLTLDHLRPWRHPAPFDLHYSEMWRPGYAQALLDGTLAHGLAAGACDADLAGHITVTHARGIVLHGPPMAAVFPAVPREDYLASVAADVLSPEFGLDSGMANAVYVVLNACRTLAFLETGEVLSKDEGGRWALQALPPQFHPVIGALLDAYRQSADDGSVAPDGLPPFIAYARARLAGLSAAETASSDPR